MAGRFRAHHAQLLHHRLAKIDFLEETIATLTTEIDRHLLPFAATMARLETIPGINQAGAAVIIAETGGEMRQFPTAAQLCSGAALCPGHHESAGKRQSGRTRQGTPYLRAALVQAALRLAAARKKGSALPAKYRRIRRHRGHKKAVIAVAHQILEIADYVMRDGMPYEELGDRYVDQRHAEYATRHHVRHLEALGYQVTAA